MRNRRVCIFLHVEGQEYLLADLAEKSGLKGDTIKARFVAGISLSELLDPSPKRNLSGLALGGLANGLRNKRKTHCPKGHEYTPENTAPNGKNRMGRKCKRCHADRQLIRNRLKRTFL